MVKQHKIKLFSYPSLIKLMVLAMLLTITACNSSNEVTHAKQADNSETAMKKKVEPIIIRKPKPESREHLAMQQGPRWCFSMKVPDGNWGLKLYSVYQKETSDYVALALLSRKKGGGIQVIGKSTICAPIDAKDKNVEIFIIGKTWGWENKEKATFVKKWPSMDKNSILVYRPSKNSKPIKPEPIDNPDL